MADDWEEDTSASASYQSYQPPTQGRTFGSRGRGFIAPTEDRPVGGSRFGGSRENGDRGGFRGRREENGDDWGSGGGRRNDGGGFRGRRNEENGGDDWGSGGGANDDGGYSRRRNYGDGDFGGRRRQENGDGGFRRGRRDEENGDDGHGGGGRRDREGGGENGTGENGEPQKPKSTYIPEDIDDSQLFEGGISSGINFDKFDDIPVKMSGDNVPKEIHSFQQAGLRPFLLDVINRSGYAKPTPIQKHSIPVVMTGRDLMGCAQTGSGKTAAFLVPIINMLLEDKQELSCGASVEPQALIVAPTRELVIQIYQEARKFSLGSTLKVGIIYGGTQVRSQIVNIQRGCHILVATMGRLNGFLSKGNIGLGSIRFLVLDEADRMLDMGFLPEVEKVVNRPDMPKTGERQTLMFSATLSDEVQRLAGKFLHDYIFIAVGIVGGASTDVDQVIYSVGKFEKRKKLVELLEEKGTERTLVFVEQKRTADIIATFLSEKSFPTTSIHGDREQRQREEALADFKRGKMDILVATAVAARGLDIKNVKHVINFDLPKQIDEYVHRIGRTGRVGNRGLASSFYDPSFDSALANDLVRILRQADKEVPDFLKDAASGGGYGGGGGGGGFGGSDYRNDDDANGGQNLEEEW